tara:strand:+ start:716 stop:1297 length:582 start_codon:yes stop_codon:yes gene_type:complete
MSNEIQNIHQRILAVMSDLNYVQKSDKKVNNQYTFVTHDAVSAALHPLLVTHGIVTIPRMTEWAQDGNRTSVNMEVDFVNVDAPEDKVTVPCFGFGIDPQDKGPGKAVSYATKYAMLKLFVLATGDDPEKDNINHVAPPPDEEAVEALTIAANEGLDEFRKAWKKLPAERRKTITPELQAQFKALTEKVSDVG